MIPTRETRKKYRNASLLGQSPLERAWFKLRYDKIAFCSIAAVSVLTHRVDVNKPCRVYERSGIAPKVVIVPLSIQKTLHFLHVGYPVDLSVCDPQIQL